MISRPQIRALAEDFTPPALFKALLRMRSAFHARPQPTSHYDRIYAHSEEYAQHFSESMYYFIWCVILDRIRRHNVSSVLDIGCGPGQFAALLQWAGVPSYAGIDISENAIQMARAVCPEYRFAVADIFQSSALDDEDYDTVTMTEFLEHVDNDTQVLQRVKRGTLVIATVPNFSCRGHVRYFPSSVEVRERYARFLEEFEVSEFLRGSDGAAFFLFTGIR